MPRAFSASERQQIESRLREAALAQFSERGLRRANVAELARAAGIAKGSFYLFFASKEALMLELLDTERSRLRADLAEIVEDLAVPPRERIERFIRACLASYANNPLLARLRDPEEAEVLARSTQDRHPGTDFADDAYLVEVLQEWQDAGELSPLEPDTIIGLVRAIRTLGLEHTAVGDERFDRTVDVIAPALADYLGVVAGGVAAAGPTTGVVPPERGES